MIVILILLAAICLTCVGCSLVAVVFVIAVLSRTSQHEGKDTSFSMSRGESYAGLQEEYAGSSSFGSYSAPTIPDPSIASRLVKREPSPQQFTPIPSHMITGIDTLTGEVVGPPPEPETEASGVEVEAV